METPRADLVVLGDVVVAAEHDLETARAIGIAGGRVVALGERDAVVSAAAPGARVIDAAGSAVIPGLHDAHIHLADLARTRRSIDLAAAQDFAQVLDAVSAHVVGLPSDAWVVGRGWSTSSLDVASLDRLEAALAGRPAFLQSRDGHSAWASEAALRAAGVVASTDDPHGGRIERTSGRPNGILRETAVEIVRPAVMKVRGEAFTEALAETVEELRTFGLTGVTDAGDFTAASGRGRYADLGDSLSSLAESASALAGRLEVDSNLPADALGAAIRMELRSGSPLGGASGLRLGWVKVFSDGALGSRTAALFEPYSCEAGGDRTGILTVAREQLERVVATAHASGIAVAVHAIGDRANAMVVDVLSGTAGVERHRDRIEHAQLIRAGDQLRLGASGIVASMQPVHCPADRAAVEECWQGRQAAAYPWRSLRRAGALLAFGSDAPVEPVNPWLGMYAAVRRRYPGETETWHGEQSLTFAEALRAYTLGPALAAGRTDYGHLRIGSVANLAILDRSLGDIVAMRDGVELTRAQLTMVRGEMGE